MAVVSVMMPVMGWACGPGYWVDWGSRDIFQMERPLSAGNSYKTYANASYEETVDFWYGYMGRAMLRETVDEAITDLSATDFEDKNTKNPLVKTLKKRGDRLALSYLRLNEALNRKMTAVNGWSYSLEDEKPDYSSLWHEIAAMQSVGKLGPRVDFLKMRCLYAMKRYDACISLWKSLKITDRTKGIGRRIYGYVGGVYLKQKKYNEALSIFYELGDNLSVHKCVNALMSKGGMDILMAQDVNALTLRYVAQDYANYFYHYHCSMEEARQWDYEFTVEQGGVWESVARDYEQVVALADSIARDPRTENKMFWNAFIGFMKWVNGEGDAAYRYLERADSQGGTQDMHDHVKTLKLLAALSVKEPPADMDELFVKEYRRLYKIGVEEYGRHHGEVEYPIDADQPENADWIIFSHELYLRAMAYYKDKGVVPLIISAINGKYSCENVYDELGQRIVRLDRDLQPDDLEALLEAKHHGGEGSVEKKLLHMVDEDDVLGEQMLDELLGTKYLRLQEFDKARELLEKVPVTYMAKLSIAPYLAARSLTNKAFCRTQFQDFWNAEAPALRNNVKLEYAKEMQKLEARYASCTGEEKARTAYEMANRLYQASPHGDLWAITEYSWSVFSAPSEMNKAAIKMLRSAIEHTQNADLKKKAWFAMAVVPTGETGGPNWDYDQKTWSFDDLTPTQHNAYAHLKKLVGRSDALYRSCDVLRCYIQRN